MGILKLEDLPQYNYDDYKNWEGSWELIYGVAYSMAPAPSIEHQKVSNKIAYQLELLLQNCQFCQALLPVDWKISDDTVIQPDNLVICHQPLNGNFITQAPKIIFEILSKSTYKKDLTLKYEIYEREGVNYYIIVNPNDKIAKVYYLENGKYIKVGDFVNEIMNFDLIKCKLDFDFSKIW